MTELDYLREETVDLDLFCSKDFRAARSGGLLSVVHLLRDFAGDLAPDKIAGRRLIKLSDVNIQKCIAAQEQQSTVTLHLGRLAPVEFSWELNFARGKELPFWLSLIVPMSYFTGENSLARSQHLSELIRRLADECDAEYGYAHSKGDFSLGCDPHRRDPFAKRVVYEVYWLNVYGPSMLESIDRARVDSLEVPEKHQLRNGGVLFLTSKSPADFASEASRIVQARALVQLRPDVDLPIALETLRQRSAQLVPVEPHWDADMAALFALLVDDHSFAERSGAIRRLNEYRVLPVTEFKSASEMQPADADGMAMERIELGAEQFIALVHQYVPQIADQTNPDLLPRIDHHFWRYDYPASHPPETISADLVPAAGAFIGKALVEKLGGRWHLRQSLDETAVVIGNVAWLPFLRARRYLGSRQCALDYSLNQFYRFIERESGKATS